MSELTPTYTFEGDEIFAIHEGSVIASGTDMASVESDAVAYLESLTSERDKAKKAENKKKATHIITPNGVKGEILGRTPDVWGEQEQITARFANGQISTFMVHGDADVQWVRDNSKTASASDPVAHLAAVLDEDYDHDIQSLTARHDQLLNLVREASRLAADGAPYTVEIKLDEIRTAAENERLEVKEALDHLQAADYESFIPDAPFAPHAVEQADLGTSGNDWLDVTTQQMIAESEGVDYDKLLSEGPALYVTELDTGALADAGVTREMALSHVVSKTAGFTGEEVDEFREKFVARVEVARRHELASRKETNHKEAAAAQETQDNAPDEALFL
jgi:hypothetical protein